MSQEQLRESFKREPRYIVLKLADIEAANIGLLTHATLNHICHAVASAREQAGKPPFQCVVVEQDWPEYEPTWRAIEARVTGAPQPEQAKGGEPVAWRWMPSHVFKDWVYSDDRSRVMEALRFMGHGGVQPLYTHPAPAASDVIAMVRERHRGTKWGKAAECICGAVNEAILALRPSGAVTEGEKKGPLLVRDVAEIVGCTVHDVSRALVGMGKQPHSTNMALTPDEAVAVCKALRPAQASVPDGWRLVPVEPTQAMCQEGQWKAKEWPKFPLRITAIWQAMLAAAPNKEGGAA